MTRTEPAIGDRVGPRWRPMVAALVYVGFIVLVGPWWSAYELSTDEGMNVMKAALVAEGYDLYDQVWSDQPPVFTVLLALLHRVVGFNIAAARCLVLAFAALLIASLFRIAERTAGQRGAWLAVFALTSASLFQSLSVCVAIGLPAIALALTALDHALAACELGDPRRLAWSGVLFALSAETKIFTLLLLPAMIAVVFSTKDRAGDSLSIRSHWSRLGAFLVPAAVVFFFVAWLAGDAFYKQLVVPHLQAQREFSDLGGGKELFRFLVQLAPLTTLLGLAGLGAAVRRRSCERWVLLLWLSVAGFVLVNHRPLWNHHPLLLVVPLAWASAYLLPASGQRPRVAVGPSRNGAASVGVRLLTLGFLGTALFAFSRSNAAFFRSETSAADQLAFEEVSRFAARTHWLVTDRPIDAYRNELLVPPSVAVFSDKRRRTGNLTDELLIGEIRKYEPEQIYFRRFEPSGPLREFLASNYVLQGSGSSRVHFVSRALAEPSSNSERERSGFEDSEGTVAEN